MVQRRLFIKNLDLKHNRPESRKHPARLKEKNTKWNATHDLTNSVFNNFSLENSTYPR